MKRKINLVGQNTLTVSLPRKWVEKNNIKKGDEIEVIEDESNTLIISTKPAASKEREIHLTIEKDDPTYIRSLLGSLYRKGYDKIYLKYPNYEIYKKISEAASSLMGYEIIDFSADKCTIRNMIIDESSEFDSVLRRIYYSLKMMNTLILEDIKSKKFDKLKDFKDMRISNWKLRDYALRIIWRKNLFQNENFNYSLIIWNFEKISNQLKKIYEVMTQKPKNNYSELTAIFQKYAQLLDLIDTVYYKKETSKAHLIDDVSHEISNKCATSFSPNKDVDLVLAYIIENSRRLQDLKSSILMIHLDSS